VRFLFGAVVIEFFLEKGVHGRVEVKRKARGLANA
jgi:hypothetical protein